jgi:hypothetical protein
MTWFSIFGGAVTISGRIERLIDDPRLLTFARFLVLFLVLWSPFVAVGAFFGRTIQAMAFGGIAVIAFVVLLSMLVQA